MPGSAPSVETDPLSLIGTLIDDRYRVVRLIGRGGMGYVYQADHERIQRPVAIKVLSQVQARRRFEREALATAKIDHPNSVRLSDFGQLEDGTLYLVMELLGGESLGRALEERGALEPTRALRICRGILAALGHAHKNGVVHRDIKPENVHLCRDVNDEEIAKVLDFGIAKMVSDATAGDDGDKLTEVGMAIGTPTYMSPEQGFGTGIDGRTDLYSTTVMLFEMLTGEAPFRAKEPLETLRLHISTPPPKLADRAPAAAHPVLEALIADGLAKKPADRIQSAAAYIDRIDAALEILAAEPSPQHEAQDAEDDEVRPEPTPISSTPSLELAAAQSSTAEVGVLSVAAEPRARPRRRDRLALARRLWPLWVVLGAVVVIGLLVADSGNERAGTLSGRTWMSPRSPGVAPLQSALADRAAKALSRGESREAIAILESSDELPRDAAAQLVLGHAHVALKNTSAALAAYQAAIELVRASGRDARLLRELTSYLDGRNGRTIKSAFDVLAAAAGSTGNVEARGLLADVASRHPRRDIREAAQQVARRLGLEGLDWLAIYLLDLQQGRRCKDRLAAVAKLRALGDKAAIVELRKAERRMGGGLLGIGRQNVNRCLADDAREAADHLESL